MLCFVDSVGEVGEGLMWMQQPASEKSDMQIPCHAPLLLNLFQLVQMNHLHLQMISLHLQFHLVVWVFLF
jgi:hypothetical protein